MYEIKMPKFGLTMEEGIIEQWFKEEGDYIKRGEPLLEVSSDKIINQIESPVDGKIYKIFGEIGETYKVGETIGLILLEGEDEQEYESSKKEKVKKDKVDRNKVDIKQEDKTAEKQPSDGEEKKGEGKRIKISPAAKRLAKDNNIDIANIKGSGPGGRIILKDIEKFIKKGLKIQKDSIEEKIEIIKLSGIRKTIAKKLSEGFHSAVTVTNFVKADFTNFISFCKNNNISITSGFIYILQFPLKIYKKFNAHFDGENLKIFNYINIGMAVDTEQGLIVPVIKNIKTMNIADVHNMVKVLVQKARSYNLSSDEVKGATFSITNLGMMNTEMFTPVINPPEVAILGIGSIKKEIVIKDENTFTIRDMGYLSLSYDHRVIDGADAAKFLNKLISYIEKPEF